MKKLPLILLLVILLCTGCADSISIGGAYLQTDIYGQEIREVMPVILVNFKLGEKPQ